MSWPALTQFVRSSQYRRKWRRHRAKQLVWQASGGYVMAGPFAGMRYITQAVGSAWCPKLLRTYEREIQPAVAAAIAARPDVVVNLGAAEGYYVVGMARALPEARVIGYEARQQYHRLIERLARRNAVSGQIVARGLATLEELETDLATASRPLVICDVDGGETHLLDPAAVPTLRRSMILVELHDALTGQPITPEIVGRFESTHAIEILSIQPRTAADLPPGVKLPRRLHRLALSERDPGPMNWAWMTPEGPSSKPPAPSL